MSSNILKQHENQQSCRPRIARISRAIFTERRAEIAHVLRLEEILLDILLNISIQELVKRF